MTPNASQFFIGRQPELQELHRLIQADRNNESVAIGISGGPGLGKSTLLRRFLTDLEESENNKDFDILSGQCIDLEAVPYLPFVEALRRYLSLGGVALPGSTDRVKTALFNVGKDIAGLAPVIGPWLAFGLNIAEHAKDLNAPAEVEQGKLFFAISQVLTTLTQKKKVVLVIEDIHWADRSTLSLLQYLCWELQDKPIVFLLTFRSGAEEQRSLMMPVWRRLVQQGLAHEVSIKDFSSSELDLYLARMFQGDEINQDVRDALFTQTNGNPFFLSQIIPVLLNEELLIRDQGVWQRRDFKHQLAIPASIEATIQETLDRLTPETQSTLEVAAVIGERFEFPVLVDASNQPEPRLDEQVDYLIDSNLIAELPENIDVFQFLHAITRNVVYDRMTNRRRRRIHLRVAQTVEQIYSNNKWDIVEVLAHHYAQGGNMSKAAEYYLAATQKAISVVAYDEALQNCQYALEQLSEDDPRYIEALETAGRLADRTSQWPLAKTYYQNLLSLSTSRDDLAGQSKAYEGIGMAHFREAQWLDAETASFEHLRLANKTGDDSDKSNALFHLGLVYWRTGRWEQAGKAYREAMQIQEELGLHNQLTATIAMLGVIYRNMGEYDQALTLYQQAIDLHDADESLEQYWLGVVYNNQGTVLRSIAAAQDAVDPENESSYWDRAVDAYQKSIEILAKIGSWRDLGNAFNNLAMIYRTRARKELQKALEYCDTAERYLSRVNSPIDLIDTRRHQGAAQTQLGRFDEARQRLEEGIAIAERIGAADRGALVLWEMGALFQKQQQVDKAREYYRLTRQRFVELGATHRVKKLDAILKQLA